jgi:hypothetical protein
MTVPNLSYVDFLDLAAKLECVGVEVRNDIDRELFDGVDPVEAGEMAKDRSLRLVGLSQVYPFNTWDAEREVAVRDLIAVAEAVGAETISLIPRNDGTGLGNGERQANLRVAMKAIWSSRLAFCGRRCAQNRNSSIPSTQSMETITLNWCTIRSTTRLLVRMLFSLKPLELFISQQLSIQT